MTDQLISFIVIGKNEGFKLLLCLSGIYNFCKKNAIRDFEIIYCDSRSVDGSVEQVLAKYPDVKVLQLTKDCNAAIGRNCGAGVAKGQILFFIDGDMELASDFVMPTKDKSQKYLLFSGQLVNYSYDTKFTRVIAKNNYYPNLRKVKKEIFFGGLFVIEERLWRLAGGMRTNFVYGEDLDLSIRLSSKGFFLQRYPEVLAIHHTTDKNPNIMQVIKNACYSRGYYYRRNFLNKFIFRRIVRSDPTAPVFFVIIIPFFLYQKYSVHRCLFAGDFNRFARDNRTG